MSKELALETNDYVANALKNAQESTGHQRAWCVREPKKWALVAQHITQQPCTVEEFRRKHKITKNFYYDVKTELMADPECQLIRNAWAAEISSVMFEGLDTHRKILNKFGDGVESGAIEVDENVMFKSGKSLQALNDIHGKLTGNNVQKHVVEHIVSQEEYESKADELKAKIAKAKEAKKVESEIIEVDETSQDTISGNFCGFND